MIRAEQIPDEVVEAFRKAWMDGSLSARAAIAAALSAWPGVDCLPTFGPSRIILPLPQKEGDA
jgi:hypothetical protein